MLSNEEIDKRFPVWEAMSDLFLDTDLQESDYKFIANTVLKSGYSPREINSILWQEVLLGVGDNLRCIAGEWAGFNPVWLKDRMLDVLACEQKTLGAGGILSAATLVVITQKEWLKVCRFLPKEHAEAMQPPTIYSESGLKRLWKRWFSV